jgi:type II secretory ATPase GspE/PulE/Tfp pilus assembly ATPase PilB-like protein
MANELSALPSKVPLEQFDVSVLGKDKIREMYRSGKLPMPEALVEEIILRGVKEGANDIHFEPFDSELRIRLGREGVLTQLVALPKEIADNLTSVLKTKAAMNAFEKKKVQEGRFSATYGAHQFDIRVATLPVMTGERIALRLLQKTARVAQIQELGFSKENLDKFRSLLKRPNGLLLVTGPAGSGKTTTTFAAIRDLWSPEKNIITIENPVEYKLDFASQVQTSGDKTYTFVDALRATLRQEPNIILLGEIRDAETGIIAAEAALTGNLILSTMLSGDAVGAVSRLLNLGVSPYWLAATLIGVVYQKLVRKICDTCKQEYQPAIEEAALLSPVVQGVSKLYRGKGCAACNNTGYIGRTAIHEIVLIDDVLHDLIYQQATILKLKEVAVAAGFENIRIDAARKVAAGITTIDEFRRALG